MYFQYGEAETAYLSARDERMAAVIAQAGHIEREVDTDLFSAVVHLSLIHISEPTRRS